MYRTTKADGMFRAVVWNTPHIVIVAPLLLIDTYCHKGGLI